jgi:hypothetical protein
VALPPIDGIGAHLLMTIGVVWILVLVNVFERSRERTRAELDQVLRELDEQSETLLSVAESQSDVVFLLDKDHQVVVNNRAAREAFPALSPGARFFTVVPPARAHQWQDWLAQAAALGHVTAEEQMETPNGPCRFEVSFSRVSSGERLLGFTLVARDVTKRRAADAAMRVLRGQLLDASRRAGRAEVAASLMHNIGNALNGASVSVSELQTRARGLRVESMRRASALLREQSAALEAVLGDRAGKLLAFIDCVSDHLESERSAMIRGAQELDEQIACVGDVVCAYEKQAHAREVFEDVDLDQIVRSALEVDEEAWKTRGLVLELAPTGTIVTIRQKLLDIVVALLGHAREVKVEAGRPAKPHLTLRPVEADRIALAVTDQSVSLDTDQALRLLGHGSTLHAAALAAADLGGLLRHELPPGGGNRFVLELPRAAQITAHAA